MNAHAQSDVVLISLGMVPDEMPLWELGLPLAIRVTTGIIVGLAALVPAALLLKAWVNWVTLKKGSAPLWSRRTVRIGHHIWVVLIYILNVYNAVCIVACSIWLAAALVMDVGGGTVSEEDSSASLAWAAMEELWRAGMNFTEIYPKYKDDLIPEAVEKLDPVYATMSDAVNYEDECPSYCLYLTGSLWEDDTECMCDLSRVVGAADQAHEVWRHDLIQAIIGMFLCYCGFCWATYALTIDLGHARAQSQQLKAQEREAQRKARSGFVDGGSGDLSTPGALALAPAAAATATALPSPTANPLYSWHHSCLIGRCSEDGPLLPSGAPRHPPSCAPPGDASLVSSTNGAAAMEEGHASATAFALSPGKASGGIGRHKSSAYPNVPDF